MALFGAAVAHAASFRVPTDGNLVRRADAIVIGTITDTHSRLDETERIVTVASLAVSEIIKGTGINWTVEIIETGGVVGNIGVAVSGSPNYQPGEKVLVFLRKRDQQFRTWGMMLGKFNFATDGTEREMLLRGLNESYLGWEEGSWEPYVERGRDREKFLAFVRAVVRGSDPVPDYFLAPMEKIEASGIKVMNHFPAGVYTRGTDQTGPATRWKKFDLSQTVTYTASGGADATQQSVASNALSMWRNDSQSNINTLTYGGTSADPFNLGDNKNTIVFNVPGTDPNLGGSTVGFATWSFFGADGSNVKNGTDFGTIVEGDIKIEAGLTGNVLTQVAAHEVGHTLGARHSNMAFPGEPSSTNAIMRSSASGVTSLQDWDKEFANHVYGDGTLGGGPPPCTPPSITVQPQSQTITSGSSANLSVTASGTTPFTYQWFRGSSGDTSTPVGTNSPNFNTGALFSTTNFWVRVTGQCGSPANSNTATISIAACTPPSITSQPQSTSVTSGQSATLALSASGTGPLTIQWFRGPRGDTSSGVLGTGTVFNTGPLTQTSTFWARVTGQCSPPADSVLVTVTVTAACVAPNITQHPQSTTVQSGQSATLSVSATGTNLIIEWFRGNSGDLSSGVLGTGSFFNTGPLTSTTSFWARVRNACGQRDSNAATVSVGAACPAGSLCLLNGRYQLNTTWRDSQGNSGIGNPVQLTSDSGYFWFFGPTNIELILKVLNGCPVNNKFWVFGGGLTDVEVNVTVRDTSSGQVRNYFNARGTPFQPIQDTDAFPTCGFPATGPSSTIEELTSALENFNPVGELAALQSMHVEPQQTCVTTDTAMCLSGDRFRVEANWFTNDGNSGVGHAVRLTDDSGYFWFFGPANIELVAKVLNACGPFNSVWVFAAGLTNVRVEWTVTDTRTGVFKRYTNPLNTPFAPVQDTSAFATCP